MEFYCEKIKECPIIGLQEDLGLVKNSKSYVPKEVECLELSRSTDNSGVGCLYFRGVYLCDSLENPQYFMPFGIYRLAITYSSKFKKDLPQIFVPKHQGVRIHAGNYIHNSTGCVLVGIHNFVGPIISYSTITLDRIIKVIKQNNIQYFKFA